MGFKSRRNNVMGILSLLLWMPVIGVLLLLWVPARHTAWLSMISHSAAVLTVLLTLWVTSHYDAYSAKMQFTEHFIFNTDLKSAYALAVDGLSLPLVLLTSVLTCVALLVSTHIKQSLKAYYISLLLLEFGILGVFLAQDWVLFYLFWEVTLMPLFFLLDRWGGKQRHSASLRFVLYSLTGSVFILAGLFAIAEYLPQDAGTLISTVTRAAQTMPQSVQVLVLISFLIGFGVKMPLVPLHGWLTLAHQTAPTPVNVLLSGVLLKMGAYGLLRAVIMLPTAVALLQPVLIVLALGSMLYGGLLAWRQSDLKTMLAYSSIAHIGVILLGIATLNLTGLTATLLQMVAQGLIAGALFLFVGLLIDRTGLPDIQDYSALTPVMPRFAMFTTLTLLAATGLPGTVGFVAELHTIIGGFERWGSWMVMFSLSLLLSAAYAVRTLGLLFMGPTKPTMFALTDLNSRELVAATVLVAAILFLGFAPAAIIDLAVATLTHVNATMNAEVL